MVMDYNEELIGQVRLFKYTNQIIEGRVEKYSPNKQYILIDNVRNKAPAQWYPISKVEIVDKVEDVYIEDGDDE